MARLDLRPAQPTEMAAIGAGIARAFDLDSQAAAWMRERWPSLKPKRPGFALAQHRVGLLHGQIVAHAEVTFRVLRYGTVTLQTAGIGSVYTERGYRKRGYGAQVTQDALTYAIERGAHLALLNGLRGYYLPFGFLPAFPTTYAAFQAADLASLPQPLHLRAARADDLPALVDLYERHWGPRVCFTRSARLWWWRVTGGDDGRQTLVAVDAHDRVHGYLAVRDLFSPYVEAVVDDADAAYTLLGDVGRRALKMGRDSLRWLMPPDDALFDFARQVLPLRLEADYSPDGGWMARPLDIHGLLHAILPEVSGQAQVQGMPPPRLQYTGERVEIRAGGTWAQLTLTDFLPVLFGAESPWALRTRCKLDESAVRMLAALFPPRVTALGAWDWF